MPLTGKDSIKMIQDHTKGQSNSISAIQENYGGLISAEGDDDAVLRMNS